MIPTDGDDAARAGCSPHHGERSGGTGDNTEEPLGKTADIYRVNSDGTIEALESARVEAAENLHVLY